MDRSFRAIPQKQRAFDVGKELLLVVVGEQVTVVDAGQSIGMSIDASKTLLDAIKALGTSAVGTVRRVSKVTGAAEIRIVH